MDSIKLVNEWKYSNILIYDIIKKPVQLGGFVIESVYIMESSFVQNNRELRGIIKIKKNELYFTLILHKISNISIYEFQTLNSITISIENGEKSLVFLSRVNDVVVFYIEFEGCSINFNNNTYVDIYD